MLEVEKIRQDLYVILMDVLGIDREEIEPSARFFEDLGGESIDLLELSFQCEQQFGVKVRFEKMLDLDSITMNEDGSITAESLASIRTKFPFLDLSGFDSTTKASRLRELLTVNALAEFLQMEISASPETPKGKA